MSASKIKLQYAIKVWWPEKVDDQVCKETFRDSINKMLNPDCDIEYVFYPIPLQPQTAVVSFTHKTGKNIINEYKDTYQKYLKEKIFGKVKWEVYSEYARTFKFELLEVKDPNSRDEIVAAIKRETECDVIVLIDPAQPNTASIIFTSKEDYDSCLKTFEPLKDRLEEFGELSMVGCTLNFELHVDEKKLNTGVQGSSENIVPTINRLAKSNVNVKFENPRTASFVITLKKGESICLIEKSFKNGLKRFGRLTKIKELANPYLLVIWSQFKMSDFNIEKVEDLYRLDKKIATDIRFASEMKLLDLLFPGDKFMDDYQKSYDNLVKTLLTKLKKSTFDVLRVPLTIGKKPHEKKSQEMDRILKLFKISSMTSLQCLVFGDLNGLDREMYMLDLCDVFGTIKQLNKAANLMIVYHMHPGFWRSSADEISAYVKNTLEPTLQKKFETKISNITLVVVDNRRKLPCDALNSDANLKLIAVPVRKYIDFYYYTSDIECKCKKLPREPPKAVGNQEDTCEHMPNKVLTKLDELSMLDEMKREVNKHVYSATWYSRNNPKDSYFGTEESFSLSIDDPSCQLAHIRECWKVINGLKNTLESQDYNLSVIGMADSGIYEVHEAFTSGGTSKLIAKQNFIENEEPDLLQDAHRHGTHCAAIAVGNEFRARKLVEEQFVNVTFSGVCPSAKVVFAKVLDSDGKSIGNSISEGIEWMLELENTRPECRTDIISLSVSSLIYNAPLQRAIHKALLKGKIVICAASNKGREDITNVVYPGRLGSPICIGSHGQRGQSSTFSPVGKEIDFLAPGEDIWSAKSGSADEIISKSGTSMAAPFVAGVAALVINYAAVIDKVEGRVEGNADTLRKKVCDNAIMREILKKMSASPGCHKEDMGYGNLDPWRVFKYGHQYFKQIVEDITTGKVTLMYNAGAI